MLSSDRESRQHEQLWIRPRNQWGHQRTMDVRFYMPCFAQMFWAWLCQRIALQFWKPAQHALLSDSENAGMRSRWPLQAFSR